MQARRITSGRRPRVRETVASPLEGRDRHSAVQELPEEPQAGRGSVPAQPARRGRRRARTLHPQGARDEEPRGSSFGDYVETFLAAHEGRDGTVETYAYRLRPHVVPTFGRRPLDSIKLREWRAYFAGLKRGGMPDSTRSGIKKAVSALYGMAVEDEHLVP